jgi:maltose phosphorylase
MVSFMKIEGSEWEIAEYGLSPETNRVSESLFSLGNEAMGLRGFFEEDYSGDTLRGCYTAGIYYPDKTRVGWWKVGYPEFFAKVLNGPNWAGIRIELNGKMMDLNGSGAAASDFVRRLDLRHAVYSRSFVLRDADGLRTAFRFERFVSMTDKNLACVCAELQPLDGSLEAVLTPYIDGNVCNEDANYGEDFWTGISERAEPYPCLTMETRKTLFRQSTAMACRCLCGGAEIPSEPAVCRPRYVGQTYRMKVKKGAVCRLVKMVSVCTSRDYPKETLERECLLKLKEEATAGYWKIRNRHFCKMEQIWDLCDVEIDGDPAAQQGIRYSILELVMTYFGNDVRLNIGPKGFTGEKYGGGTYWDTEGFCFPFYLNTDADIARSLLLYRYRQLPMAKENAKKLGLQGALYPMVTMDGHECHNEWEITFEEIHRNGAIAYVIYEYTRFTGKTDYLQHCGMEVLVELCRFWASRVTWNSREQCYMILGVTGPNEYENNVNNNYYTNFMAAWTLKYTLEWLEKLHFPRAPDEKERQKWRDIAEKMYFPYCKEKQVFEQNDLFMQKELLPADTIPKEQRPIHQHWSWDRVLRSCFIKQADVLQAVYFFPEAFTPEEQRRNFDFYEPMTVHESSLSPSVHAIVACRIGYTEKAYSLYMQTARLDLENINGDTRDGLHITSMGATWAAVIQGFAGVNICEDGLSITPHLPAKWKHLRFRINFRGASLNICTDGTRVDVKAAGKAVTVKPVPHGCKVELEPDSPERWKKDEPKSCNF